MFLFKLRRFKKIKNQNEDIVIIQNNTDTFTFRNGYYLNTFIIQLLRVKIFYKNIYQ